MATDPERQLSRIALRQDQILEIQFGPWQDPGPEVLRIPGMNVWWNQMKLARERDIASFARLINNFSSSRFTVIDGGGP